MKISKTPTDHILLLARCSSEWDEVRFVLVYVNEFFKDKLRTRRDLFKETTTQDTSLYHFSFWDYPLGFYYGSKDEMVEEEIEDILHEMENVSKVEWVYLEVEPGDFAKLTRPESALDGYQMKVIGDEFWFTATGKHTDETFWSSRIQFEDIL